MLGAEADRIGLERQGLTALAWLKLAREEKHEDEQAMALLQENERIAASDDAGVSDEHLFSWQCRVHYLLTRAQPEYGAALLKLVEMDGAQSGDGCLIHPHWLAHAAGECLQQKDNLAALALYRRQEERLLHFPPSNEALYIVRYNIVSVLGMLERWEEAETEARGLVEFTTGFGADAGVYGKAAASLLEKTCRRELYPAEEEEDAP